jgi:hypothetical protein
MVSMKRLSLSAIFSCSLVLGSYASADQEAVDAVRRLTVDLGIRDEFDSAQARVVRGSGKETFLRVMTPNIVASYRAADGRVTQILRMGRIRAERVKSQSGPVPSDAVLIAQARVLLAKMGTVPAEGVTDKVRTPSGDVEYGFRPLVNGFVSRFGFSSVRFDPQTGEFLVIRTTSDNDVYASPQGVLPISELRRMARSNAEQYVSSLPASTQERHLPLAPQDAGEWILYGNTKPLNGKNVRDLVYETSFGNIAVMLDAKSGELLDGAIGGGGRSTRSQKALLTPRVALKEPTKQHNDGTKTIVAGGATAAIIAGIALFLRRRA